MATVDVATTIMVVMAKAEATVALMLTPQPNKDSVLPLLKTHLTADISNKLQNKVCVTTSKPFHSRVMMQRHAARAEVMVKLQDNLQQARTMQKVVLEVAVKSGDIDAPMKLAVLDN